MSQILTTLDFNNSGRIINLPDGINNQDPATIAQLNAAVEGLSWKDNVQVASPGANINIASPGATIDGVTMTANMRVLLKDQTDAKENGIYIWNGVSTPLTRSQDANAPAELSQAIITVELGSSAGATFRQTSISPTIGTDNIAFVPFGVVAPAATTTTPGIIQIATQAEVDGGVVSNKPITPATLASWAGRIKKFAQNFGDGTATSYTITHNLNTRDVDVSVFRNSGNYDKVIVDIQHTTVNAVTIVFNSAPASNAFRAVILG